MKRRLAGLLLLLPLVTTADDSQTTFEWTERELRVLQSFSLDKLDPRPDDPSNAYARDERAASFGKSLFFDKRFSSTGELSCASCHQPEKHFTDGVPRAIGVNATGRNTMTVVGSAYQRWFYWDGRRDSLWSQALIPFEAPDEMGSSRTEVIKLVMQDEQLRANYRELFGDFPPKVDPEQLPAHAGPFADKAGKDSWNRLERDERRQLNTIYANLGKAIAAFEHTLNYSPTRFDNYLAQLQKGEDTDDKAQLSDDEKAGARLFMDAGKTQCLQCHNGPTLSNGDFHNIGTGTFSGEHLDFGRVFGLQAVLIDEFNCLGPFSDARAKDCTELRFLNKRQHVPLEGSFKTPSLRNVAQTAPYFHDGSKATLEEVLAHYNMPPSKNQVGDHELKALGLTAKELEQLAAFLLTLSD